jgi:hypothetical protein
MPGLILKHHFPAPVHVLWLVAAGMLLLLWQPLPLPMLPAPAAVWAEVVLLLRRLLELAVMSHCLHLLLLLLALMHLWHQAALQVQRWWK